jgi:hypothetical protein
MADGAKLGQQAVTLPTGGTAARPASPGVGDTRYNSDLNQAEVWNGSQWGSLGGAQSGAFYLNNTSITSNYTIPANTNAMSAGPITIADGVTVTISDGSSWTVV